MLNVSQQLAYEEIVEFCKDPDRREFILTGAPGTGKSYLLGHIEEHLCNDLGVRLQVLFTATTNSAADNVPNGITIYNALGLRYDSKKDKLVPSGQRATPHLLFIDEYTFIDPELYSYIRKLPKGTKIVYVGDKNQLLAVGGVEPSVVFREPDFVLDIPMRSKSEAILETCDVFLTWVKRQNMRPIEDLGSPDVIGIPDQEFYDVLHDPDQNWEGSRVITSTNKRAIEWNQTIRRSRGLPSYFVIGERVSNNQYRQLLRNGGSSIIPVGTDAEYTIINVEFIDNDIYYTLRSDMGHYLRVESSELDLRSQYCSTIHKAQGRSFDTVYVDLSGFPSHVGRGTLVRSLYVGASRARERIVFIGTLSDTLWGKI